MQPSPPPPNPYAANIPRFLVSRALYNFLLFLPIWVVFVQRKHGIDLVQVTLLDSAFWLTMALAEVPTGAVADTVGRKQSYAIGIALSAIGNLLFGLAPTYPLLLVANSLWALALTFGSGADMAFFYDTLRELGRTDEYPRFRSLIAVVDIVATGLGGLLGAVLFAWQPEAPFILYSALLLPALALALTLKEPPREPDPDHGTLLRYGQILRSAGRALRERPDLRHALAYSNLLPVAGSAIGVTLIQPFGVEIGLPVEALGIVLLWITVARVAGSGVASPLARRLGDHGLLRLALALAVIGVVGIGGLPNLGGLAVFGLAAFAAAASRPTIETIMLSHTPGSVRATILSVDSLIFRLLLAAVSPFAGLVAEAASLRVAFAVIGAVTGALVALTLVRWGRTSQNLS